LDHALKTDHHEEEKKYRTDMAIPDRLRIRLGTAQVLLKMSEYARNC